jgi:uncharacterized protein (TIGR03435 family)
MRRSLFVTAALLLVIEGPAAGQSGKCLHASDETRADRTRREKAVELAHEINGAQKIARRLGRRFVPLDQLVTVPRPPDGFRVQLHTDGAAYAFSIKDTMDPCLYALFSDESGDVYEGTPVPDRPSSDGPSLNTALKEQLGLKLEATRGPVVVTVDSVSQPEPD